MKCFSVGVLRIMSPAEPLTGKVNEPLSFCFIENLSWIPASEKWILSPMS
jgi:hypothetical protein